MYKADYSSILGYLVKGSKTWGTKEAMVVRRRIKRESIRYSDLSNLLVKYETWFTKNKISSGEKILFWGLNCPEYSLSLLSSMCFNRVAIPLDWRNSTETIQ